MLACAQEGGLEHHKRLSPRTHLPILLGCRSPIRDNIAWGKRRVHPQEHTGILSIPQTPKAKEAISGLKEIGLNKAKKFMA